MGKWLNTLWFVHAMECYPAIKSSRVSTDATTWWTSKEVHWVKKPSPRGYISMIPFTRGRLTTVNLLLPIPYNLLEMSKLYKWRREWFPGVKMDVGGGEGKLMWLYGVTWGVKILTILIVLMSVNWLWHCTIVFFLIYYSGKLGRENTGICMERAPKKQNYLLEGGPVVVWVSPARWVF